MCRQVFTFGMLAGLTLVSRTSPAAIEYDQNVTPNVIFSTATNNGGFTTDRAGGIELGLRATSRLPMPPNLFNSNGDGTYTHVAGSTAGQPQWGFEWSINTSWDGSTNLRFLRNLDYVLRIDMDPGVSTSFLSLDPINSNNPVTGYWDHALGDAFTQQGAGSVATSQAEYNALIANKNVAQNSWRMDTFPISFDPTIGGVYTFELLAYAKGSTTSAPLAGTRIDVIVQGAAIPEPLSFLIWGCMIGCALLAATRSQW